MNLGLDFDGVVLDIIPEQIAFAARAPWRLRVQPHEILSGAFWKTLSARGQFETFRNAFFAQCTLCAKPMPGVVDALTTLPVRPYLITARRGPSVAHVVQWLHMHGLDRFFQDVQFVPSSMAKDIVCKARNIDVYIDDNAWVLDLLPSVRKRILFDPWRAAPPSPYARVHSWPEVFSRLTP